MSLLRRRARGRSCLLHGDNGCEIQGEAGRRQRVHDRRMWVGDVEYELLSWESDRWSSPRDLVEVVTWDQEAT